MSKALKILKTIGATFCLIILILFFGFDRERNLMEEGLTFKQARVYVKEKDDLRKGIEKLKRENELIELRQELEKLKRNKLGR